MKLPRNTHAKILYSLCEQRPIEAELKMRTLKFIFRCVNSEVDLVRSVARHILSMPNEKSVMYNNFVDCNFFQMSLFVPKDELHVDYHNIVRICGMWTRFVAVSVDRICSLYELIMLRDGILVTETGAGILMNRKDITDIIYRICTE